MGRSRTALHKHLFGKIRAYDVAVASLRKLIQEAAISTSVVENASRRFQMLSQPVKFEGMGKVLFSGDTVPVASLE